MSILDLFRRKSPAQALLDLRHAAVLASLNFREHTKEGNAQLSANGGAELLYFLLHITDTVMHQQLTPNKRAECFDFLTLDAIRNYAEAMFSAETSEDILASAKEMMLRRFNARQTTYARCTSLAGEALPTPGSKMFALAFLVHRALGRTERVKFDELLAGTEPIKDSEFKDFPDVADIVLWSALAAGGIQNMKILQSVRALR